jgi:D-glycero-D-manno-heptose 1,7-bisphosphate phosphatase
MKDWTLFLDRDGVLNRKIENGYVTTPSDLIFLPGTLEALSTLSTIFGLIIVVTNQRGIARGLYSISDLQKIHKRLISNVEQSMGRIDHIYFCPHNYSDNCNCRKPKVGMALKAKEDYPNIDFNKSIMVGDSVSDIDFGKSLGMKVAYITNDQYVYEGITSFKSLLEFSNFILSLNR